MRVLVWLGCILISTASFAQKHYNVAFDTNYISAIMQENITVDGYIYGIGGAICSTGECGYLTKYSTGGERYWTIEYPQIDINSHQVSCYKDGKIYITGRAKDSIATKTLVLDTLGNVLADWNYSVEGATSNFSKEVYYEEDYYYFITNEVINQDSRGTLYKCDYAGNLIDRLVFPSLEFTIPLAVKPYRGNLLISINHRYQELCPFGLDGIAPGAAYLAEVDKVSMEIIREKKDVCFRWISNDIYITPTSEIIRTVVIRDTLQEGKDGDFGLIYYDDDWEVKDVKVFQYDLVKAITNLAFLENGQYYTIQTEGIPQTDGSNWPFADLIIQKWTPTHEIIWEKRYTSPTTLKRLQARNLLIDENSNLHIVGYVDPDFPSTKTYDFWLFSVDSEGCHNGNCNDVINLDNMVKTNPLISTSSKLSIYPNPVSSVMFIDQIDNGEPIRIIDIYGNIVLDRKYAPSGLDISELHPGIYYISINGYANQKVIKI